MYFTVINKSRFKWHNLINTGRNFYRNDKRPSPYNRICSECITNSIKNYVVMIVVILITFTIALIGPIYIYYQEGKMYTLYGVRLPYLSKNPHKEYVVNIIWQLIINLMAIVGTFILEAMITIVNDTITVSSKLCRLELNELSDDLENEHKTKAKASKTWKIIIKKMIYMDE